jgi:hypothetical protein
LSTKWCIADFDSPVRPPNFLQNSRWTVW